MSRLWPLYSLDELDQLPEPKWLVDGYLTDGLTVLYGPGGVGKTFLALSWALSIASGATWFGRAVQQVPVLYVSGEGHGGLSKRVRAWRSTCTAQPEMYVAAGGVHLTNPDHRDALLADVHATQAKLLVIDTWARSMAGADENSAKDAGLAVNILDTVRRNFGCASLVIHHSGVDRSRLRGSTALFNATDAVMKMFGEGPQETDPPLRLKCERQKDGTRFRDRAFELRDAEGSCVLIEAIATGFTV